MDYSKAIKEASNTYELERILDKLNEDTTLSRKRYVALHRSIMEKMK